MSTLTFQMPQSVEVDEKSLTDTFGRFTVQPLEKGYGVTLGNAFRRVLLASLPGYSIASFRIDGLLHEFSTIPGVVEDVTDLVLNLKNVRLKATNKRIGRVVVSVKGPGKFVARDLEKASNEVEILNPNQLIATLNKEANFEIEFRIARGRGYVMSENNKIADQPLGTISIDSIFTPIVNVNYTIESTRVGQQTDFEKLSLEIETDGSITPNDALAHAGKVIKDHVQLFLNLGTVAENEKEETVYNEDFLRVRKLLQTQVNELELSVRSHNCLRAAEINTVGELVRKDENELLKFRNFGRKSLAELSTFVEENKLTFGMDVDKYLQEIE